MMNIGFVAHDKKKELMVAFCIAYKGILKEHTLYATGTTGAIIYEETGLQVNKFSYGLAGQQQLEARAAYNELDMVVFFRDPNNFAEHEGDLASLLRHCDANNIPIATNLATAEILIHGLQRGDIMWRENLRKLNLSSK